MGYVSELGGEHDANDFLEHLGEDLSVEELREALGNVKAIVDAAIEEAEERAADYVDGFSSGLEEAATKTLEDLLKEAEAEEAGAEA